MRRRDSYLGGAPASARNPCAYFRHFRRKKVASGALHKMSGDEYAAEIKRCEATRSSVDMASNLAPYVASAVAVISSRIQTNVRDHVKKNTCLPALLDRMLLAEVAKRLGTPRLEESKRRLIRSMAIDMLRKMPTAKR